MSSLGMIISLFLLICDLNPSVKGEIQSTCHEGFYSNGTGNDTLNCNECSVCPPGTEVKANCTNQSDTVCRSCDHGTFSSGGIKCMECSLCPPGSHVSEYCSLTSDTKCVPCEKNMYSSDWSILRYCKPCKRCSRLRAVLKNCTSTQNYECGGCMKGYFRHPNLPACMRCSYCYPNIENATFLVPECSTQSDDPSMRCMPVPGPPRERPVMFAGVKNNEVQVTTVTVSEDFVAISSTQYPSLNSVIPPHIVIPMVIVVASVVVLVSLLVITYKLRHRCGLFPKRKNLYRLKQPEIETVAMNGNIRPELTLDSSGHSEQTSSDEENPETNKRRTKIKVILEEETDIDCVMQSGVLSPLKRTSLVESNEDEGGHNCLYYAENEGFDEGEDEEDEEENKTSSTCIQSSNEDTSPGSVKTIGSGNVLTIILNTNGIRNDFISPKSNRKCNHTHKGRRVESQLSGNEAVLPRPIIEKEAKSHVTGRDSKVAGVEERSCSIGPSGKERNTAEAIGTGLPKEATQVSLIHGNERSILIGRREGNSESETDSDADLESSFKNKARMALL